MHEWANAPVERLILCWARTEVAQVAAAEAARLLAGPVDWDRLLRLAHEQAVLPLVARQITRSRGVPAPISARAEAEARAAGAGSLSLSGLLIETLCILEDAGIGPLPFKGPTLAVQAYGDPGLRTFADLDILVRPAETEVARARLIDAGFRPVHALSPARRALLVRHASHETLERDGMTVELHWRIASPVSEFGLDYERLWGRLTTVELAGRSLPALRAEDLLLVLVLHGTKHAWERLGWICDVAELLRATPDLDWNTVASEASRMRCGRAVGLALKLAGDLLHAPVPRFASTAAADRAIGRLAEHVGARLFMPSRAGSGTLAFHLGTREGWRAKLRLALGGLSAINQRDLDLLPLPDPLLPLYFISRPARLAGKAVAHALRAAAR